MRMLLVTLTVILGAAGFSGCGAVRTEHLTFIKKDASETRMDEDTKDLRHTKGVTNVISSIDAGNMITLQLYIEEGDRDPGLQKVRDLGYSRVRN